MGSVLPSTLQNAGVTWEKKKWVGLMYSCFCDLSTHIRTKADLPFHLFLMDTFPKVRYIKASSRQAKPSYWTLCCPEPTSTHLGLHWPLAWCSPVSALSQGSEGLWREKILGFPWLPTFKSNAKLWTHILPPHHRTGGILNVACQ